MNALVVYDSQYGNTERAARTIGEALGAAVLPVSEVKPEQFRGLDLLVVGSPTQRFRPTSALTDFLKQLPAGSLKGIRVAAFDTRIVVREAKSAALGFFVRLFGPTAYAATHLANGLKQSGGKLVAPPEGFFVAGTEGPLKDGELARAAAWARILSDKVEAPQPMGTESRGDSL